MVFAKSGGWDSFVHGTHGFINILLFSVASVLARVGKKVFAEVELLESVIYESAYTNSFEVKLRGLTSIETFSRAAMERRTGIVFCAAAL